MRLLRELLDSARTAGVAVVVGEGCPQWLADLAEPNTSVADDQARLHLVGSLGLSQTAPQLSGWALVVLEEAMAQLAPVLAAKELADHGLQVVEVLLVPPQAHRGNDSSQPECLVLTRVVGQPLAVDQLNPWELAPKTQTLAEQLMAGNQPKLQAIANGLQLNHVAQQRDAAIAEVELLKAKVQDAAERIEQLQESNDQLSRETTDRINTLQNQVRSLRARWQGLENMSTWRFLRRKLGTAIRKVPGGGQVIKQLKRIWRATKHR